MKYKKGDKIILTSSMSGAPIDTILEIVSVEANGNNGVAMNESKQKWTIYLNRVNGGSSDTIVFATREVRIERMKECLVEKKKDIAEMEKELSILVEFDSDEAYTAHKLHLILKAKTPKAIEEVLKTLKETHFI